MNAVNDLELVVWGRDTGPSFCCSKCNDRLLDNDGNGNAPVYITVGGLAEIVKRHLSEVHEVSA